MTSFLGCRNQHISPFFKCRISGINNNAAHSISGGGDTVIGLIRSEYTESISSNWISPFEGDTLYNAGKLQKVTSLVSSSTETAFMASWQTKMDWRGTEPMKVSIPLVFIAESDPESEVHLPVNQLRKWVSPELGSGLNIFGSQPSTLSLSMCGVIIKPEIIIQSVSVTHKGAVDKNGKETILEVDVEISAKRTINASEF